MNTNQKRRQIMAHLTVKIQDKTIMIRSQAFSCEFQDVGKNKKAVLVFLRALCSPETGKPWLTYQTLADAFGYAARQNVENFVAEFHAHGDDFEQFLFRTNTKKERLFALIEAQILDAPLLSLHPHYLAFCEEHPEEALSEPTFRKYVNAIEGIKILKRIQRLLSRDEPSLDVTRYLQELLELHELPRAKKKEIVELVPAVNDSPSVPPFGSFADVSRPSMQKKLLVVFLSVCNVSQEILALLCGVGKTSIHNAIYAVCSEELDWRILREIVCWSGRVSFDEKWVKIKGEWYFVLCAVDAVSGFPLLIDLYPTLDTVSWTLFFKRFKALYGVLTLIQCDGSHALAAARELVFHGVRYQFCKFHKLRNLIKRLRWHIRDPKLLRRCIRLSKHMFTNTSVSSRKNAAKRLQKLAGPEVSSSIESHILMPWRKLTLSLTTNASERFNRKIEKCFSGRYGIPSPDSAKVLLRGLWLKELLLNGQQHIEVTSELRSINMSRICQEHLDTGKILHFFHDDDPSQVEKLA
jgi:transposase-like protein